MMEIDAPWFAHRFELCNKGLEVEMAPPGGGAHRRSPKSQIPEVRRTLVLSYSGPSATLLVHEGSGGVAVTVE